MPRVQNLTKQQVDKIQIDEGLVYVNFGSANERLLGPTRGGAEFTITNTVRDVEFDGRKGKSKGLQVIEEQAAALKVTTLCCSQDDLLLGIPGAVKVTSGDSSYITNPDENAIIGAESYMTNAVVFARLFDGSYKQITIMNPMHEGAFTFKCVQKSENEHALELVAHFDPLNASQTLWKIEDVASIPVGV